MGKIQFSSGLQPSILNSCVMSQTCCGFSQFPSLPNEVNACWYYCFYYFYQAAMAQIIRGGLNAIGPGQTEAGLSQGFTPVQIMVYIIMPQAIRKMLPAIISQIVTVIKDTSFLYSVIALQELFRFSAKSSWDATLRQNKFLPFTSWLLSSTLLSILPFQVCHVMWLSLGRASIE